MTFLSVLATLTAAFYFWPTMPGAFAIGIGAGLFAITPIIGGLMSPGK